MIIKTRYFDNRQKKYINKKLYFFKFGSVFAWFEIEKWADLKVEYILGTRIGTKTFEKKWNY